MKYRQRVQAVIIQDKKVLFGVGMLKGKELRHFFIGGGIDEGECPEGAMLRELREEANVEGEIILKFLKEYKENHHTFLVDIGNKSVTLGYDPEDVEVSKPTNLRALQKLEFISINEYQKFSPIDIEYFKILIGECNHRGIFLPWFNEMKILIERYEGENI